MKFIITLSFVTLLFSCTQKAKEENTAGPAVMYFNGDILTMEGDSATYVEALVVRDGKILFAGAKEEAMAQAGSKHSMVNLQGKTMLPGFIDPHSHFINSLSMSLQANCSPPPVGTGNDVAGIVAALKEFSTKNNIPKGQLIIGYGYDDTQMPDGKILNRDDLDAAFPDHPVMVIHVSLHGGVLNSLALKKFGYSEKTVTPPGGIIVRKKGTNEPFGLIMETAFLQVFSNLPKATPEQQLAQLKAGQMIYAEAGVTTAQEGATHKADLDIIANGANQNALFIDVISYPFILEAKSVIKDHPIAEFGSYKNHMKIGGVKITADGSPQGRTAFFTTPYLTGGPDGQKNWVGEPTFPQDSVNAWMKWLYENKVQLIIHGNGDGAIDMILKGHEYAANALQQPLDADRRTTVIHSQFVRKDQLEKYKQYNIIPSMYTEHTFFFGDAHIKNRGLQQASFISPLNTTLKMGIPATNHTDFNVLPINQMMVVWSAVNRTTRSGVLLGGEERVTPYQALQCITLNAAHQNSEDNIKGSLKAGKLADLVILEKNPLKVDRASIKEIQVMETIKEGKTIFRR